MVVALVQGIVGAFDKYFSPLDEAGGEEAGDHAKDNFLWKRRVHFQTLGAEAVPSGEALSPESPLPGVHDPKAQQQIGEGVSQNAR